MITTGGLGRVWPVRRAGLPGRAHAARPRMNVKLLPLYRRDRHIHTQESMIKGQRTTPPARIASAHHSNALHRAPDASARPAVAH